MKRKKRNIIKNMLAPYVNCSMKGAISLFMAVLMTPFLTIAMVLVDTGRFNSAVSILDEAMGVSSTSTLAEMDSYLHERWGIFGVSQEDSVQDIYSGYLSTNGEILGESIQLDGISAEGMYPLSDNEVLYNQLLEYCKLNAPTELALEFGSVSEILESLNNLKSIRSVMNVLTGGTGAIDATVTLAKSADELKGLANELDEKVSKYHTDYQDFERKVTELLKALQEPEPKEADFDKKEDYKKAKEAWEKAIEDACTAANGARDTYAKTLGELQESMGAYKEKMSACNEAMNGVQTKLAETVAAVGDYERKSSSSKKDLTDLKDKISKMEESADFDPNDAAYKAMKDKAQSLSEDVAGNDMSYEYLKAQKEGLKGVQKGYEKYYEKYDEAAFTACMEQLSSLKSNTEAFQAESLTKDSSMISRDSYYNEALAGYISAADIDAYMKEQEDELLGENLQGLMGGLVSFFNAIFKTSLFYEPEFSANINTGYYAEKLGGLAGETSYEGSAMAIVNDVGGIFRSVKEFVENVGYMKLISALMEIGDLIKSFISLCKNIILFAFNILKNLADVLNGYDRLYYNTYATFNLPCRTDKQPSGGLSFKGMTGYQLDGSSLPDQGITSDPLPFDDFSAAIDALKAYTDKTGDDLTFSGAELEYILYGSNCEIANQMYTFFALYLMRLLMDIGPVTANSEVQALAAASTLAYPIVMLLFIFAEPLADAVVLSNGGQVKLVKTTVFLTPSGFPRLLGQLVKLAKFSESQKGEIKDAVTKIFKATKEDYDYEKSLIDYDSSKDIEDPETESYAKRLQNFSYREHCFLLLLLTVSKEQQFARLKNLIQMETLYHYQKEGSVAVFDLEKSYTYLDTEVTAQVRQMMPSLISSSLFRTTRQQYRGY